MVNKVKLDNTGDPRVEEPVEEFEATPDEAAVVDPTTGLDPVAGDQSDDAQVEADADAAGINESEKEAKKARTRELNLLKKDLKEYGTLYGGGKTSMINLAERIVEAAMKKAITFTDAEAMYKIFKEAAEAKSTVEDGGVVPDDAVLENPRIKSGGKSAKEDDSYGSQLRKIEAFITLGNTFDERGLGALDLIRRASNIHLELLKGNRETLKTGSTYTIMVSVANAHIGKFSKRKIAQGCMTDDEIRKYLWVEPKQEAGPADEWKKVMDALLAAEAAKKGSHRSPESGGRNPITSDTLAGQQLDRAIEHLRNTLGIGAPDRLAALDKAAEDAQQKLDEANAKKAQKKAA